MKTLNLASFIFLLLLQFKSFAQQKDSTELKYSSKTKYQKRSGIWFTPSRADEINGLTFGFLSLTGPFNNDSLKIRGIHIDANPLMAMVAPVFVIFGSLMSPFSNTPEIGEIANRNIFPEPELSDVKISGLNLAVSGTIDATINGLSISTIATFGEKMNGVSLTGGMNKFHSFNGVLIAGLQNKVTRGKGIQVALFNYCQDCKGLQVGLLNKIGKRTTPFFNVGL